MLKSIARLLASVTGRDDGETLGAEDARLATAALLFTPSPSMAR